MDFVLLCLLAKNVLEKFPRLNLYGNSDSDPNQKPDLDSNPNES